MHRKIGLITKLAAIPLLIIMIVAFGTTKVPILTNKGFWAFAHEYRTNFTMTLLLIYLLIYGGGRIQFTKEFLTLNLYFMKNESSYLNES
jgi:uncharacterized membrane protein YphA (DoxX/SURF4 family)